MERTPTESTVSFGEKFKKLLFPFRWLYILVIAFCLYAFFFSPFAKSEGVLSAIVTYSILLIAPIVILEIALYVKKHSKPLDYYLRSTDFSATTLDAVRTDEDSLASDTEEYAELCYEADIGEAEINDVSMVDGMEGHEFEYFCADLLRKNGFAEVSVTRGSGDQGVDVLATKGGIKYAIQCKNYATPLSNTPVQEVSAGKIFYNCHVGVVLTNSTFTPGAVSLANATGVLLWGRSTLAELMKNEQSATEKVVEAPSEATPVPQHREATPAYTATAAPVVTATQKNTPQELPQISKQHKSIRIDSIDIDIDTPSADRLGIVLDNFGIETDEDDDDQIELLFDIVSKNGRSIRCDMDIVCNLYVGRRKVTTERETVYKDSFDGRDSVSVYFSKKNISKTATRIELFCQKW